MRRLTHLLLSLGLALWLAGCAGTRYFQEAPAPTTPPLPPTLAHWPYKEYWTGIVFNGAKIGFSRLTLRSAPPDYELDGEAAFVLHFLGLEKKFRFRSRDTVHNDLTLVRFDYDYLIDGSQRKLVGMVEHGVLHVRAATQETSKQALTLTGPVYPTSALVLYPLYHGLAVGREYHYTVYDGETQTLAEVTQKVLAHETSTLFEGPAYKVETRLHGHTTTTWLATDGPPPLELALNGVLVSGLEGEKQAKRYLALASLNKQDVLLDFSRVRTDRPIPKPRELAYLKIVLDGIEQRLVPTPEPGQRCTWEEGRVTCEIRRLPPPLTITGIAEKNQREHYLRPTLTAPSIDPRIGKVAREIAGDVKDPLAQIPLLVNWLQANIEKSPVDVFSALDVLETKKAECQGHAYLYTALGRALGIPTRVVNGLAYSDELGGFLYHSWNESLVGGTWISVDPTFGQVGVDATHIKLIEGESTAELMPLVDVVGRIKARIASLEEP